MSEADFDRFEASLNLALPTPRNLPIIERKSLVSAFKQQLDDDVRVQKSGEVRTRKITISKGLHYSRSKLQDLRTVTLATNGELKTDEIAFGKVLICRIASTQALRLTSLQFLVEDPNGLLAIVYLYHLPANYSDNDLNTIYAKGEYFAIKEPDIRSAHSPGSNPNSPPTNYIIRINSPTDIVRLSPISSLLNGLSWTNNEPASVKKSSAKVDPIQVDHKVEGNQFYAKRQWFKAIASYTKGLEVERVTKGKEFVVLRSNRSQTLMNLKRPGAALRDCTTCLLDPYFFQPTEDESVTALRYRINYRAALAEYQINQYTNSLKRLNFILKSHPNDTPTIELLAECKARINESLTGIYDWSKIFSNSLLNPDEPLDIAEFVGSQITQVSIPGKGRGLIATRDISPGELLLVSRPLAFSTASPESNKFLVGINLLTRNLDPYPQVDLIALLIEKMIDDPSIIPLVFDLYPGDAFSSNGFDYGNFNVGDDGFDVSRLAGITTFNSFHPESLLSKSKPTKEGEEDNKTHSNSAIYHFASFLNHGCVGNVSYIFIGDTIILRCRVAIKKGEELLDSYIDPLLDLKERQAANKKHGFICNCELCTADREESKSSIKERLQVEREMTEVEEKIYQGTRKVDRKFLESTRLQMMKVKLSYKEGRTVKPALYSIARVLATGLSRSNISDGAIEVEIVALEALGATFDQSKDGRWKLLTAPRLGDVNGVMSCLFIASQYQGLGQQQNSKDWIRIAREIEKGQAGEEIFSLRYKEMAQRNRLKLDFK